jgi:hypothetical protein
MIKIERREVCPDESPKIVSEVTLFRKQPGGGEYASSRK